MGCLWVSLPVSSKGQLGSSGSQAAWSLGCGKLKLDLIDFEGFCFVLFLNFGMDLIPLKSLLCNGHCGESRGWCLNLYVMDEITRHDSSAIIEIVARTLESVHQISVSKQRPMPTTVLLASDNTVREAKNQFVLRYLSNMVGRYKVRVTGLVNLRKSHTHDALDQCWGVLARKIASCDRFQSPTSVISILEAELNRTGLRGWVGVSTEISVVKLDGIRAWKDHFSPQQVGLSGGLLEDKSGNHCFVMMLRRSLSSHQKPILSH